MASRYRLTDLTGDFDSGADSVTGLSNCCDPTPYRRFFNRKEAERTLRAYRRKGLDSMAADIFGYLTSRGVQGSSVLEVGGGVGAIQIELLKAGAGDCVNVELSAGYEEAAERLAAEEGFGGRTTRRFGDFVELQEEFDPADIVVMNRVVCCYPWMEQLMEAAIEKTAKYLAIVIPRDKWWVRAGSKTGNSYMAMRRCDFRSFVHPVDEIEHVATRAGLVVAHSSRNFIWQSVVMERAV